jgi:VWFA-related protein
MGLRGSSLAVASALLATAVLHGRQAPDPQQRPPTIRTGTNVVRVDATVIDGDGKPVTDLTADDFEIREDGKPQPITSFKLLEVTGEPTDELSLPIRSPDHAAAEAARDDVRVFLVFWDDYHIDPFVSTVRSREQLTRFLLDAFGPTDLVAFMDPLTPLDAIRFTRDRRALADHAHSLKGRRGVYVPPRSVLEEGQLHRGDVERLRAQVTAGALKGAMLHLGAIREGRKSIIYIGETLGPLGSDLSRALSDLLRTANDTNTAIYTVDPRGLQAGRGGVMMRMSDVLPSLAYGSGGEPISSNDMSRSLRRVIDHASVVYLLGYAQQEIVYDGKFHEIKVRVKRPGLDVRARSGYWAPRVADMQRAAKAVAAAARPPAIDRAFEELAPANSRRLVDFWIGSGEGSDGASVISLAWTPRPREPGEVRTIAAVSVDAKNGGQQFYSGDVPQGGLTFEAAPGPVTVTFTIHDAAGDVLDREVRTVGVPDVVGGPLGLSTPLLFRVRTPIELRALSTDGAPAYAGREFEREDRLRIRFAAHGRSSRGAAITARLLGTRGARLADLPVQHRPEYGDHEIDLPLRTLAPGEFVVAIEARSGEEQVEAMVPLRVVK